MYGTGTLYILLYIKRDDIYIYIYIYMYLLPFSDTTASTLTLNSIYVYNMHTISIVYCSIVLK